MPLTRGHVLVAPRQHYKTLAEMGVQASQEVHCLFHTTVLAASGFQYSNLLSLFR